MKQPEDSFAADLLADVLPADAPCGPPTPARAPDLVPLLPGEPQALADSADLPVPAPTPAWRRALDAAVAGDPRGRQGVAERLAVTRAYVSRVYRGDLTAKPPPKFVSRVQAVLMQVDCPYLGRPIPPDECRTYAGRSYAQIRQPDVAHWRACMRCTVRAPDLPPARTPQGDEK